MTAERVVIFDFGGVLVDWNPRHLYRRLFPGDPERMERFLAEVCTTAWNEQQDAGRPWADAVAELVARHPAQADLIRAYRERWEETLAGPIDDSVAILGELRDAGHRLLGLTNWSHETFPLARARYRFFDWFHGIVVSGEERLIKPDPRLFVCLIERYRVDPARAVFIDDSPRNVAAAAALGLHAIHFRSPAALRAELTALELLR
ncbi:MAG TPA: HAD family phosphatase [Kofleriaceae bacterium]|jgi:2-haloacid dehalogenase|nr:HAD family phosphatase [Kofleriaceae bacterium]